MLSLNSTLFKEQVISQLSFITSLQNITQVENMEARLKEDIVSEVRQSGGRMLLHREEYNPATNQSSVVGYWENIFAEDVKTPAEVYAALRDGGYDIIYRRIPLTREREPLATDIDAIQCCKDE